MGINPRAAPGTPLAQPLTQVLYTARSDTAAGLELMTHWCGTSLPEAEALMCSLRLPAGIGYRVMTHWNVIVQQAHDGFSTATGQRYGLQDALPWGRNPIAHDEDMPLFQDPRKDPPKTHSEL